MPNYFPLLSPKTKVTGKVLCIHIIYGTLICSPVEKAAFLLTRSNRLYAGEIWSSSRLTQNIPNVPLKIIRWNIMCSELMEFHSCPQKDRECAQVFCNFEHDPSIHELFRQMLYEIRTAQYGSQTICQHLLEILILKIIRSQQLIPVSINSIRMTKECAQIKEYLDSNYAEPHYAGHADRFDTYEQILYGALFYKICRTLPKFSI